MAAVAETVEWPERAGGDLPEAYLLVRIDQGGEHTRRIEVRAIPAGDTDRDRLVPLGRW